MKSLCDLEYRHKLATNLRLLLECVENPDASNIPLDLQTIKWFALEIAGLAEEKLHEIQSKDQESRPTPAT